MPKRAIADAMCGKLARWLRMVGIDVFYVRDPLFYILPELPLKWTISRKDDYCITYLDQNEKHIVCLIDKITYLDGVPVDITNIVFDKNGVTLASDVSIDEDSAILMLSRITGRTILTIDNKLASRADVPVLPWNFTEQLAKALELLNGLPYPSYSRCSVCNGTLQKLSKNRWRCKRCGQEYWVGSHWQKILSVLRDVAVLMGLDTIPLQEIEKRCILHEP